MIFALAGSAPGAGNTINIIVDPVFDPVNFQAVKPAIISAGRMFQTVFFFSHLENPLKYSNILRPIRQ